MRNLQASAINGSNQVGGDGYSALAANIQMNIALLFWHRSNKTEKDQKARLIDNAVSVLAVVALVAIAALAWWL